MKKAFIYLLLVINLFALSCEDKLFSYSNSLDVNKRLTIKEFLELLLTQKCNINLVVKDKQTKEILNKKMPFVRFKDYTLTQILDYLLDKRGLFYELSNNELDISYYKTKSYKIDFIADIRRGLLTFNATSEKDPPQEITNEYLFNFWDTIEKQLTTLLKNNSENKTFFEPIVNKNTGVIVVTGDKKQIKAVDNFIKHLINSLTKEVLIDVKIYSVELSRSHKTGIDWSKLYISLPNTSVPLKASYIAGSQSIFNSATFNTEAFLNFLAQNGNVNSISNPKIVTLNNQKAVISVGDTIYYKYASKVTTDNNGNPQAEYTIESKFVGVILDITPKISDNGEIILSLSPRISAFRDLNQLNSQTIRDMPPDTKNNVIQSVVRIKDGQTLVLGGLISSDKSLKVNGVPILKEIPLIKYLFSSKETISNKKELVFVITPHIINLKVKKTLKDLGFGGFQ